MVTAHNISAEDSWTRLIPGWIYSIPLIKRNMYVYLLFLASMPTPISNSKFIFVIQILDSYKWVICLDGNA